MQIKTIMGYYLIPVKMAIIKTLQPINAGEGVTSKEPSYSVAENVSWWPLWKTIWMFLKKQKLELPYDRSHTASHISSNNPNL